MEINKDAIIGAAAIIIGGVIAKCILPGLLSYGFGVLAMILGAVLCFKCIGFTLINYINGTLDNSTDGTGPAIIAIAIVIAGFIMHI